MILFFFFFLANIDQEEPPSWHPEEVNATGLWGFTDGHTVCTHTTTHLETQTHTGQCAPTPTCTLHTHIQPTQNGGNKPRLS